MPNMMSRLNRPDDVRSIIGQFQQNAQAQADSPGNGNGHGYGRYLGGRSETPTAPIHGFGRSEGSGYLGHAGGSTGGVGVSDGFNFQDFLMELEKKRRGQDFSSMFGMNYG